MATALRGAHALPEDLSSPLLHVYLADTRAESFFMGRDLSTHIEHVQAFYAQMKEAYEDAARKSKLNVSDEHHQQAAIYFAHKNPDWNLQNIQNERVKQLKSGMALPASAPELKLAAQSMADSIYLWLAEYGVHLSRRKSLKLNPGPALTRKLAVFKSVQDFHLNPDIPPEKINSACECCLVPEGERPFAVVDCTFWGSAKDAVVVATRGVYHRNSKSNTGGYVPFSEFDERTFTIGSGTTMVGLGRGDFMSLEGSAFPAAAMVSLLDTLKSACHDASSQADTEEGGLSKVPGMTELKTMLQNEVVDVLKNAEEFRKYKITIPNGILLYGPPGCGKTFIAQRLARELDYGFYEISPSSIASIYIHGTTELVSNLFEEAAASAPTVMFVDEFEGIVPSRRTLGTEAQYKNEEVNEWLVQIGNCANRGILFVAATNEPWKIDEAVRRTGRLDKKIYVGPPDKDALAEMLSFHLKGRPLIENSLAYAFSDEIAECGYSASDIKVLADEAAKYAMRERSSINLQHLRRAAVERVPPSITREKQEEFLSFV